MKQQKWVLIGGIASGKSYVLSRIIAEARVRSVSHEFFSCDQTAQDIRHERAEEIYNIFGTTDSHALRKIVFNNPEKKKILEDLILPGIKSRMSDAAKSTKAGFFIAEAPTLNVRPKWATGIISVEAPALIRVTRVMDRDKVSDDLAMRIISSQSSQEDRAKLADLYFQNDGSKDHLEQQVYIFFKTIELLTR